MCFYFPSLFGYFFQVIKFILFIILSSCHETRIHFKISLLCKFSNLFCSYFYHYYFSFLPSLFSVNYLCYLWLSFLFFLLSCKRYNFLAMNLCLSPTNTSLIIDMVSVLLTSQSQTCSVVSFCC